MGKRTRFHRYVLKFDAGQVIGADEFQREGQAELGDRTGGFQL